MIEYRCPKCATDMASPDGLAGQAEKCPVCGNVTTVPAPATAFPAPQPAPVHVAVTLPQEKKVSGLGIAALVLGIIACLTARIPMIGLISLPFSGIGVLLAIIGFIVAAGSKTRGKGMLVSGFAVCIVAVILVFLSVMATALWQTLPRAAQLAAEAQAKAASGRTTTQEAADIAQVRAKQQARLRKLRGWLDVKTEAATGWVSHIPKKEYRPHRLSPEGRLVRGVAAYPYVMSAAGESPTLRLYMRHNAGVYGGPLYATRALWRIDGQNTSLDIWRGAKGEAYDVVVPLDLVSRIGQGKQVFVTMIASDRRESTQLTPRNIWTFTMVAEYWSLLNATTDSPKADRQ